MEKKLPYINQLPDEILILILNKFRHAGSVKEFLPCLCVCRKWYQVGLPIALATVVLTNLNIAAFISLLNNNPMMRRLTTSLTLQLSAVPWHQLNSESSSESTHTTFLGLTKAEHWENLENLAKLIKAYLPTLRSLSLRINRKPQTGLYHLNNEPPGWWINTSSLDNILRALPSSCTDLEIDTRGKEGPDQYESPQHLCPTICSLLPQLRILRLRLNSLCPCTIDPDHGKISGMPVKCSTKNTAHSLRVFVVSLNMNPYSMGVQGCVASDDTLQSKGSHRARGSKVRAGLVEALREAKASNMFPRIQQLDVIDVCPSERRRFDHITLHDIVRSLTYTLPFRFLDDDESSWMIRTKSDVEIFGPMVDLEELVEGPVMLETRERARFSADFAVTANAVEYGVEWSKPRLMDREQFLKSRCHPLRGWAEEAWIAAQDSHASVELGL